MGTDVYSHITRIINHKQTTHSMSVSVDTTKYYFQNAWKTSFSECPKNKPFWKVENFDFYLYTSRYVLVDMHDKRRQELLSVKMIEVCFPQKRNSRLSVKSIKTMLKHNTTQHNTTQHNTTHTQRNSIQTWQDLCNGDSHTSIKLRKEFNRHNHFIHPMNSADRTVHITEARLSRKGPRACLCHECLYHPEQYLFSTVQLGHFRPSPSHSATDSLSNLM
jgi:hypothetical protein